TGGFSCARVARGKPRLMENSSALGQLFQQAIALHRQGRLAEAEQVYGQVLRAQPDHFDALHYLGVAKAQQGNNAEAEGLISAALRKKPDSPEALSSLANVLSAERRYDEALAAYHRALAINPRDVGTLLNRGNT